MKQLGAGVRPEDLMVACEQTSLLSLADLAPFEQGAPGMPLTCQIRRGPQTIAVTMIQAK